MHDGELHGGRVMRLRAHDLLVRVPAGARDDRRRACLAEGAPGRGRDAAPEEKGAHGAHGPADPDLVAVGAAGPLDVVVRPAPWPPTAVETMDAKSDGAAAPPPEGEHVE